MFFRLSTELQFSPVGILLNKIDCIISKRSSFTKVCFWYGIVLFFLTACGSGPVTPVVTRVVESQPALPPFLTATIPSASQTVPVQVKQTALSTPKATITPQPPTIAPTPTLPVYGTLLARISKGLPNALAYSPDGKIFAALSPAGISLFDASTLKEQRQIEVRNVRDIFYRADGSLWGIVPAAGGLQFGRIVNAAFLPVGVVPCADNCTYQVAMDGTRVAVYDVDVNRKILTQANLWQIEGPLRIAATDLLNYDITLALSQDSTRLALMDPNLAILSVYQLKGDQFERFYTARVDSLIPDYNRDSYPDYLNLGYDQMKLPISISSDGKFVVVGGPDYMARVFQPDQPDQPAISLAEQAPDPRKRVDAVRFASEGQALVVMQSNNVYLYRTSDWKMLAW